MLPTILFSIFLALFAWTPLFVAGACYEGVSTYDKPCDNGCQGGNGVLWIEFPREFDQPPSVTVTLIGGGGTGSFYMAPRAETVQQRGFNLRFYLWPTRVVSGYTKAHWKACS